MAARLTPGGSCPTSLAKAMPASDRLAVTLSAGLLLAAGVLVFGALLTRLARAYARRVTDAPIPDGWEAIVARSVPAIRHLTPAERLRLLRSSRELIDTLHWEGCGGLTLTPEMRLVIAAQACLLTLHLPGEPFPDLREILVYPDAFVPRRTCAPSARLAAVAPERVVPELGESTSDGIIVLGWQAAADGAMDPGDGRNVVLHEFAHELAREHDLIPEPIGIAVLPHGSFDEPPVACEPEIADPAKWTRVLRESYSRRCDRLAAGTPSVLDAYAATNYAEFFAVATETFFERPRELAGEDPALYAELRAFYRQDPASVDAPPAVDPVGTESPSSGALRRT